MYKFLAVWMVVGFASTTSVAQTESQSSSAINPFKILPADTLTDNWFGLGRKLAQSGITIDLNVTQLYQQNLGGGLSTHRRAGRYSGRYDLELNADMGRLFNLPGGRVYMLTRGGWSDGIDASSVGSIFGVDGLEFGDEPADVWELYYEQKMFNDRMILRVGRVDLTCGFECHDAPASFDCNTYANDEVTQFLNNSLVNNPTIPFPDPGFGVILHITPVDWWYVTAAVVDADADYRETGFNTAFHGPSNTFSIYETGIMPDFYSPKGRLPGAYRVGLWYDPQAKERFDGNGVKRDDAGFYIDCDQMVFKENAVEDDSQGLGVFARYGYADGDVNEIKNFWSAGVQYQGLIDGRDDDVLGVGVGQGLLSRKADFTASNETALECYYNMQLTPWLHVSPDIQYIFNPGGDSDVSDAVVLGFRVQVTF